MKIKTCFLIFCLSIMLITSCEDALVIEPTPLEGQSQEPYIDRISPEAEYVGRSATIIGSNFGDKQLAGCYVKVGNSLADIQSWRNNEIRITIPRDYGTGIEDASFVTNILSLALAGWMGVLPVEEVSSSLADYFLDKAQMQITFDFDENAPWWENLPKFMAAIGLPGVEVRPDGEMSMLVSVRTSVGESNGELFIFKLPPIIAKIEPSQPKATGGQWLKIKGLGFTSDSKALLHMGGSTYTIPPKSLNFKSPSELEVFVELTISNTAPNAGSTAPFLYDIQVICSGDIASNSFRFEVAPRDTTLFVDERLASPVVMGSISGKTGQSLKYSAFISTPDTADDLEYCFDWGDGSYSEWSSSDSASHTWADAGTYRVRAQARYVGNHDNASDWGLGLKVDIINSDAESPVTLTLYVHENSTSGPVITGAQVTGQDETGNSFDQVTNSSGYVTIIGTPGIWQLTVAKSGYQSDSSSPIFSSSREHHVLLIKVETIDPNLECLARVIMSEASIGTHEEQVSVAWTVFNRLRNGTYGTTVCEVVNAPGQYAHSQEPSSTVTQLAKELLASPGIDPTGGATHFFSPISMPKEGDYTAGYDVGGGLHEVSGIGKRVYFPSWTETLQWVGGIPNVRQMYFMFYRPKATAQTTSLGFTSLTPSTITTSTAPYDATLSAGGTNFNNVDQVMFSWSGPDSGSATWNKGDSNWSSKVTVNSDTSMTLQPRVLYNESGTQSKTWTWTVTLRDTSGATASRSFTVTYTPPTTTSSPPTLVDVGIAATPWPPQTYLQARPGDTIYTLYTFSYSGPNTLVNLKTAILDANGNETGNQVTGSGFQIINPFENPIRGVGIEYKLSDEAIPGTYDVRFSIWNEGNTQQYDSVLKSGWLEIMPATTPLSFTSLTPSTVATSTVPYDAALSAGGANFNDVNQVAFSWSGAASGSTTWNKGDSNWNSKVTVNSDTSMTLVPRVVETSPTWSGTVSWTVTLKDTTGATASKSFTVTYTPAATPPSFTSLTPSTVTASTAPYDATLSASGTNFNNVNQVAFSWSGAASGSATWNKGDSNWNSKVTVNSDTSMTLVPRVVETSPTWSGTVSWTVTLKDTTGATASKSFTVTYTSPSPTLSFTNLTPSTITTGESTYDATLSAGGTNFNNVDQVKFSWSGPDSGSATWNKGDSNWNSKVTVNSDTSMTLQPRVLYNESGTQSKTWTWTVTLRDTSGATASRSFTVTYTPPAPVAPTISGISPAQPTAQPTRQWLTILGSGFVSGSQVTLRIGGSTYIIPSDRTEFVNSGQIKVYVGLTDAGSWSAQITNPDGLSSNIFSFQVVP